MTFGEFFGQHNLTADERHALIRHLAAMRYERTVKVLEDALSAQDVLNEFAIEQNGRIISAYKEAMK